jgi:hypothetical protein
VEKYQNTLPARAKIISTPQKSAGDFLLKNAARKKNRLEACHSPARGIAPGADSQGFTSPERAEPIVKTNLLPFGLRPVGAFA